MKKINLMSLKPSQSQKSRRSRSKKKNWTNKKRKRQNSYVDSQPKSKVYVKQPVEKSDLSKSGDKMENVEFYQNVATINRTAEKRNETNINTSSTTPSTSTTGSRHATDTDFQVTNTSENSSEESLPTIKPPTKRYQLRSRLSTPVEKTKKSEGEEVNCEDYTK